MNDRISLSGDLRRTTCLRTCSDVGGHLMMTAGFWRDEHLRRHPEHVGAVFVAELEAEELADILQGHVTALTRV